MNKKIISVSGGIPLLGFNPEIMTLNFNDTEIAFRAKGNREMKLAHWLFTSMSKPLMVKLGIRATALSLRLHLPVKGLIKSTLFSQFCGGETLEEADMTARKLNEYGVGVIMDYGVEGKSNESEFEKTTQAFLQTIDFVANKAYIPFVSLKVTGFARFELLEKIQSGATLTPDEQREYERLLQRIDSICSAASRKNKMVLIDAEESWIQNPVDELCDLMMERYNRHQVVVFNTFQLYRHDRYAYLQSSFEKAKAKGYQLGAKLVRGAYMEKERTRAQQLNYPDPIQPDKQSTDRDYNLSLAFCLQHSDQICLFIGTHNEKSTLLAAEHMQSNQLPTDSKRVYFSQLFGMSDNISFNLAKAGYHVSKYLPYGPVEDVIPYLMRRAEENTSVAGQTSRELSLIRKEIARRKL